MNRSHLLLRASTGFLLLLFVLITLIIVIPRGVTHLKEIQLEERLMQREIGYQKRVLSRLQEDVDERNLRVSDVSNQIGALISSSAQINDSIQQLLERVLDQPSLIDTINILYDEKLEVLEPQIDSLNMIFYSESDSLLNLLHRQDLGIKEQDLKEFSQAYLGQGGTLLLIGLLIYLVVALGLLVFSLILWLGAMKQLKE